MYQKPYYTSIDVQIIMKYGISDIDPHDSCPNRNMIIDSFTNNASWLIGLNIGVTVFYVMYIW